MIARVLCFMLGHDWGFSAVNINDRASRIVVYCKRKCGVKP